VPFTVFREEPLLLEFNDLVIVKVYATNVIGSGPESATNNQGIVI